jgi:VIT1/CCC1 family predicted Fe2+/Mn2+ transporter
VTEQGDLLDRSVKAERDYVDGHIGILEERLDAIDKATELLNETVNRVPTDVQREVSHIRELVDEKLTSVALQFKERDTRSEREARDNKLAVDAAFAAQEKQAVAQNESNALAINKSEKATAETIKTNQELSKATTDALTKSLDELKLQVSRIESRTQGISETKSESRGTNQWVVTTGIAALAFIATVVYLIVYVGQHP